MKKNIILIFSIILLVLWSALALQKAAEDNNNARITLAAIAFALLAPTGVYFVLKLAKKT